MLDNVGLLRHDQLFDCKWTENEQWNENEQIAEFGMI